jgi:DNA-binding CsgD family transcriptional regulator
MHEWDSFETLMRARTLQQVLERASQTVRAIGMSNFGYARLAGHEAVPYESALVTFNDYDTSFAAHYLALQDPAKAREDPRVQYSRANLPALPWNTRGDFGYSPPLSAERIFSRGRRLIMDAGDSGAMAGITVPCWSAGTGWGFASFSSAHTHDLRDIRQLAPMLVYLAHSMHSVVDRVSYVPGILPELTSQECDVLCWSAAGKTSWETGLLTRLSERTVNYHLANAARKLGVKGRRAAVARAITLGLIAL